MAQQAEFRPASTAAIAVFVDDRVGVPANGAEQLAATKNGMTQILPDLRLTGNLFECIHVHHDTPFDGLVPSGWGYPPPTD